MCVCAGGVLPPEVEEWAKQEGIKGPKLQALRNHQKVKKWTKVRCRAGAGDPYCAAARLQMAAGSVWLAVSLGVVCLPLTMHHLTPRVPAIERAPAHTQPAHC